MKIYIDSDFKCHTTNPDGTFSEAEHPFFDNKCQTFIEGFRYNPSGEMIAPWKDYDELDEIQRSYEQQLLSNYQTENTELKAQQNELITSYNEGVNSI